VHRFATEGPGWTFLQIHQALLEAGLLERCVYVYERGGGLDVLDGARELVFQKSHMNNMRNHKLLISPLGRSLGLLRRAKKLGMKTLLVNFSTHPLNVLERLEWTYSKIGATPITEEGLGRSLKEIELADGHLVLSELAKRTYVEQGVPAERVHVAHLGVELERFRYSQPPEEFRVLFVGTNAIRKGLPYLYRAWEILGLDAKLLVRGSPRLPNPPKNVVEVPWVEDIVELYTRASVTVLPSLEDGFGVTVLESLACGRPVIVSDQTGASELIEHGTHGLIVPAENYWALADAIRYLYDHPAEVRRMGREGRRLAERYPMKRFRSRVVEIVSSELP